MPGILDGKKGQRGAGSEALTIGPETMASEMVVAFAEAFSAAELGVMLRDALADQANGVRVTSITLEGGGGAGQVIRMDPERMVSILRRAKQVAEGKTPASDAPMGSHMNFNTRAART